MAEVRSLKKAEKAGLAEALVSQLTRAWTPRPRAFARPFVYTIQCMYLQTLAACTYVLYIGYLLWYLQPDSCQQPLRAQLEALSM